MIAATADKMTSKRINKIIIFLIIASMLAIVSSFSINLPDSYIHAKDNDSVGTANSSNIKIRLHNDLLLSIVYDINHLAFASNVINVNRCPENQIMKVLFQYLLIYLLAS